MLTRVRPATIRDVAPNAVLITSHGAELIDEVVNSNVDVHVYDDRPMKYLPVITLSFMGIGTSYQYRLAAWATAASASQRSVGWVLVG